MENNQEQQTAGEVREQLNINISPSWVSHTIWAVALVVSAFLLSTAHVTVNMSQAINQQSVQKTEVLQVDSKAKEAGDSK